MNSATRRDLLLPLHRIHSWSGTSWTVGDTSLELVNVGDSWIVHGRLSEKPWLTSAGLFGKEYRRRQDAHRAVLAAAALHGYPGRRRDEQELAALAEQVDLRRVDDRWETDDGYSVKRHSRDDRHGVTFNGFHVSVMVGGQRAFVNQATSLREARLQIAEHRLRQDDVTRQRGGR